MRLFDYLTLGVGRLAYELYSLGYSVQGNEFSLFMLFASDFILNGGVATPDHPLKISPWLLESRNCHSIADAIRSVSIPDIDPGQILSADDDGSPMPEFSMAAGEFCSIYAHEREASQWDAVVSSFFLDAMPNIIECLQLIFRMLKPGGCLVNFGPLLFHWSGPAMRPDDKSFEGYQSRLRAIDNRYKESIDLTYEDIREIMKNIGFDILEEKTGIQAYYTTDPKSMLSMSYKCVSFVARKPFEPNATDDESECEEAVSSGSEEAGSNSGE
jgi:carnosine N-methyltransferase